MVGGRHSVITYAFPDHTFLSGQTYNFVVPKLDDNRVIDSKTMELEFELVNANKKSWFLNNFGRLLIGLASRATLAELVKSFVF